MRAWGKTSHLLQSHLGLSWVEGCLTQEVRSSVYILNQIQIASNLTTFVISRNILEQEGGPNKSLEPSSSSDDEVRPQYTLDLDTCVPPRPVSDTGAKSPLGQRALVHVVTAPIRLILLGLSLVLP